MIVLYKTFLILLLSLAIFHTLEYFSEPYSPRFKFYATGLGFCLGGCVACLVAAIWQA